MEIVRPTLLLDEIKCKANIRRVVDKARKMGVTLRPHFKTHQSHEVGRWFREEGVTTCTVSSMRMASYFAEDGWADITVAFPLNYLEVEEINRLASSITLAICLVSVDSMSPLVKKLKQPVHCFIEIDSGYHRTGIEPSNHSAIDEIVKSISSNPLLTFNGFLTHAGQSYTCRSGQEILKIHQQTSTLMRKVGDRYRKDFPDLVISIGDTPSCSVASDFRDIGEIRPGNFVFYDLMQCAIGACTKENIAVAMACPVVALYPSRNEMVVHGGAVHFSKDFLKSEDGMPLYGEIVKLTREGWELPTLPLYLKSLSQEHGILHGPAEEIQKFKVGDVVGILPVHSCLTADAMGQYFTLEGKMIGMMPKA